MRISVFVGVSIDGFIARQDGGLDFLTPFEGEDHGYEEYMRSVDALVVGRATHETVLGFESWPWTGKRVVVLTHRPLDARHGETTHAGALAPLAARLAAEGCRRVYLDGGVAIRQGLDEDLVDDMTISTVPITIGAGRPLFGGAPRTTAWTLTSVRGYPSGLVQARYERARDPA
ncbi:MAG TPA: dihydrofolate reductase family protein [Haliangiales bacterium]|nr:dihydrofolate reductase family protein [Haliangiales bacterium]